jgi:hypothetical protein
MPSLYFMLKNDSFSPPIISFESLAAASHHAWLSHNLPTDKAGEFLRSSIEIFLSKTQNEIELVNAHVNWFEIWNIGALVSWLKLK